MESSQASAWLEARQDIVEGALPGSSCMLIHQAVSKSCFHSYPDMIGFDLAGERRRLGAMSS